MQRMLEQDQPDIAWRLFANMNEQALRIGAIGNLSELADALPRDGAGRANLSGRFCKPGPMRAVAPLVARVPRRQAGSAAHRVDIRPELPQALTRISARIAIGGGVLRYEFRRSGNTYTFQAEGISPAVRFSLPGFSAVSLPPAPGMTVNVVAGDKTLKSPPSIKTARRFMREPFGLRQSCLQNARPATPSLPARTSRRRIWPRT